MIDTAFTAFIQNLGGSDFIYGLMGIVLTYIIILLLIDYISE